MSGIVGRAAELRLIADAVETVADGDGLVLSISGEPGVGKTHLASEALRLARGRGFRTLRGTCADTRRTSAYGPIVQALRPLVDPAERRPQYRRPDRAGPAVHRPRPARNRSRPGSGRSTWPVVRCGPHPGPAVRRLDRSRLLVDDIHWADPSIAGPARLSGVEPRRAPLPVHGHRPRRPGGRGPPVPGPVAPRRPGDRRPAEPAGPRTRWPPWSTTELAGEPPRPCWTCSTGGPEAFRST